MCGICYCSSVRTPMADHTENELSSSPCREDVKLPGSLAPPGTGVIHTGNVT